MFDYSGFCKAFKCMAISFSFGFVLCSTDCGARYSVTGNDPI